MNSQAVELQRRVGMSIITRFHGIWSAGAVTGGIVASRAAAAGISLRTQLLATTVVLLAATLLASRWLLPDQRRPAHESLARSADAPRAPRRMLAGLFVVGMAIALAELPPHDWSALLLTDRFDVTAGQAGMGFVAVASGMLLGRLVGDHATDRFGLERTRRGGATLAAVGVLVATLAPTALSSGAGLLLTGLGLSSLFPLLFRAASELTHGSHSGMAAFSSGARLGFLCASPLMGLIAQAAGVATAMLVVAGTAATAVAVSRLPRPALTVTPPA
jgi:fucose permease